MNHDLAITLLDDHVDGLLSAEQNAELEAHLADCAACRDELAQLRDLLAQPAALPRSSGEVSFDFCVVELLP